MLDSSSISIIAVFFWNNLSNFRFDFGKSRSQSESSSEGSCGDNRSGEEAEKSHVQPPLLGKKAHNRAAAPSVPQLSVSRAINTFIPQTTHSPHLFSLQSWNKCWFNSPVAQHSAGFEINPMSLFVKIIPFNLMRESIFLDFHIWSLHLQFKSEIVCWINFIKCEKFLKQSSKC